MRFGAIHAAAISHIDSPITGKRPNKMTTNRRDFLLRAGQLGVLGRTKALNLFAHPFAARPNVETRDTTDQNRSLTPSESETKEISRDKSPSIEEYASVEALSQGQPVYGFDYMMYVYGVSPDLFPANVLQEGNRYPRVKIALKKSWEISNNLLGSNTAQVPRTRKNDSHPTLPVHLIDGDPSSVWCSFGCLVPDVHPEWIRIDLPIEASVQSIALVCGNEFYPDSNFGRALPTELEVKTSTDAWHWDTVYYNKDVDTKIDDRLEIKFAPRRVKQVWITGNNFQTRINTPSSAGPITFFSIVGVEVKDTSGNNLALVSRGAGVTVSSTYYGHADNRLTQAELWAPLHYDAGMTWLRIAGAEAGAYDWQYTERKKGKYEFDPELDGWLTDLKRCGVKLIWGLDIYANPLYEGGSDTTNWAETRIRTFTDGTLGGSMAGDADYSPEMMEAYLRYVAFIVRHLKGRVYVYEVGNEFTGCGWDDEMAQRYMKIFTKTYEVIKRVDPQALIMPASPDLFAPDFLLTLLGKERKSGVKKGKFLVNGGSLRTIESSTLATLKKNRVGDAAISVKALNRGRFGIVLRYINPDNFLLAGYATCWPELGRYTLVIAERQGKTWNKSTISSKSLDSDLSQNLTLNVRAEGRHVSLEVSDGNRTETLRREVTSGFDRPGAAGLLQLTGASQAFGDFSIRNLQGSEILRDEFRGDDGSTPVGWEYVYGPQVRNPIAPRWAPKIDGLGWHPYNPPDRAYCDAVREFKRECAALGFSGRYYASELYNFFTYPPRTPLSELQHGVVSASSAVGHSGLDMVANTQILHFTGHATADSNCRIAWPSEVVTPVQPSIMYYVWRNLATVLDDFHATEFPAEFGDRERLLVFTFQKGSSERLVAAWLADPAGSKPSEISEETYDLHLRGTQARQAWGIDIMNGTEQELAIVARGGGTVVAKIRVKNYPTLVRIAI
jgi:hypothetical protein